MPAKFQANSFKSLGEVCLKVNFFQEKQILLNSRVLHIHYTVAIPHLTASSSCSEIPKSKKVIFKGRSSALFRQ